MIPRAVVARIEARLARRLAPPAASLVRFVVDDQAVGFVTTQRAKRLQAFAAFRRHGDTLSLACEPAKRDAAMAAVAMQLAREGVLTAWRDERYAVRAAADAPPLFEVERAAARYFGIHTYAAHVNGLVRAGDGIRMWIARRSAGKAIDPGMLDNLVGGGIAAGASVASTVVKESWEEAGIPPAIATTAVQAAELTIFREQPDGIQHETIYAHDLWLPVQWTPANQDGEAVLHRLATLAEVAEILAWDAGPNAMTADASLVAFDCLRRLGAVETS